VVSESKMCGRRSLSLLQKGDREEEEALVSK